MAGSPGIDATVSDTSGGTSWVMVGSVAAGIGAYLFQIVGTRALGTVGYAPISVLWTIQYLALAIGLAAAEAYVTREAALGTATVRRDVRTVSAWILVGAAALTALTFFARRPLFGGEARFAAVAGVLVVAYGLYMVIRGLLAGHGRFRAYGLATSFESSARLVIAVAVMAVAATSTALAWIMPLGPALVVVWWLLAGRRAARAAPVVQSPIEPVAGTGRAGRFLALTTTANAAAQALLAGGPLVLPVLGAPARELSVFFITITAARTPMTLALNGVASRILPPLTRLAVAGEHAALRRVVVLSAGGAVAVAVVAALAASVVGPQLVAALFGAEFRPDRLFVTLAGAGTVLATANLVLNQVLIASSDERRMPVPWLAALAVAVVVILVVPSSPTIRVAWAFVCGEAVALVLLSVVAGRLRT